MENNINFFTEPEELISWVTDNYSFFQLKSDEATILLNYMEGHGYGVGCNQKGEMIRQDLCDNGAIEDYSLRYLLDAVSDWNDELISSADDERNNNDDFISFANAQNKYTSLKEEEKVIMQIIANFQYAKEKNNIAPRLFVDMDGTLAVFTPVDELETLYQQGYFLNLTPHENVVFAIKTIICNNPDIDVHILSAYLTDSKYALQEKNEWLDKYLPEIDSSHRIFVPCGSDKKEGIPNGIRDTDFLLDDYTHNLIDWQPPGRGIKLLNDINHTRGSWEHDRIRYDRNVNELSDGILSILRNKNQILDEKLVNEENYEIIEVEVQGMDNDRIVRYEVPKKDADRLYMEALKYQTTMFSSELDSFKPEERDKEIAEKLNIKYIGTEWDDQNSLDCDESDLSLNTIKIYAGMTGEYEVISTNAPTELLEEQLRKNNALEENNETIENPYDLLEKEGFIVKVVCSSSDSVELDSIVIDLDLDYCDYNEPEEEPVHKSRKGR